ncbi:MAG TPA: peroxiredoxin [Rhodospirillales bacterium]|nr:peroxiredoxin [Rhodospirillales bacterium]
MTIDVGDRVPSANLKEIGADGLGDVPTDDLFKGRKVAVFGLPGAFTPTCSAKHLPGFVENAGALKAKGVDEIVCVSVNDAFVMKAWSDQQGAAGKVRLLADGNAELAKAMGLALDASGYGMGTRSQRFSMVVEDSVVKAVAIDPPGSFKDTSAETMLGQL